MNKVSIYSMNTRFFTVVALWLCILIRKFPLQALCSEFMAESAPALCLAVTKHLGDSEGLKNSGDQNW